MNEDQQSSSLTMGTILMQRDVVPDAGVLGFQPLRTDLRQKTY